MATRAERSDAAYESLKGVCDELSAALKQRDVSLCGVRLETLRQDMARFSEQLSAYDERRIRERMSELEGEVAQLERSMRPRFTFRTRLPRNSPDVKKRNVQPTSTSDVSAEGSVKERRAELIKIKGDAVYAERLVQCIIIAPCVQGPLVMRNCTECLVYASARQVRLAECEDCVVCVRTLAPPVIELCKGIALSPFDESAQRIADDEGAWNDSRNCWKDVKDFNWLKDEPSPNWFVVSSETRQSKHAQLEKLIT